MRKCKTAEDAKTNGISPRLDENAKWALIDIFIWVELILWFSVKIIVVFYIIIFLTQKQKRKRRGKREEEFRRRKRKGEVFQEKTNETPDKIRLVIV